MSIAFRALVRKDLRVYFRDRRSLLMGLVAPIAFASFFGYIFGGGSGSSEAAKIPILAVDQDNSAISREIVAGLRTDKSLEVKTSGTAEAREAVRKGRAVLAVVIPQSFGTDAGHAFFNSTSKPAIGIWYDPSHAAEFSMVQGMLTGHIMQAVSKEVFGGETGRAVLDDSLAQVEKSARLPEDERKSLSNLLRSVQQWNALAKQGESGTQALRSGLTVPYETRQEAVTSRQGVTYNGYGHSFGGMGIQFILFAGIDAGITLLTQRRRGLWQRLRAAPLSRAVLLGSRAASSAITSMFSMMILFLFARLVFGVRIEGSLAGFLGICAAFSLMTGAIGLLIAALGKTPEATRGLSIFVTLLMVMLGGAWVPSFLFPAWLQKITVLIPTRWAMDGLDGVTWRGLGFGAAAGPIAVLLASALIFGALAIRRFRWEEDG